MTTSTDTGRDDQGSLPVLVEHHRTLEERLDKLLVRTRTADPGDLRAEWAAFERELLKHMELEEAEILRGFASHDPDEARALLSEHGAIRNALLDIGINLDLHCLRAEAVEALVTRLKAHARREDGAFYPWAKTHVSPSGWQAIKRSLMDAVAGRRRSVFPNDRIM
jgi:hypothetical protein